MKTYRPQEQQLTSEEIEQLKKYTMAIEMAVADGKISDLEIEVLSPLFRFNCSASSYQMYEKIVLYRQLVIEKLANGELQYY